MRNRELGADNGLVNWALAAGPVTPGRRRGRRWPASGTVPIIGRAKQGLTPEQRREVIRRRDESEETRAEIACRYNVQPSTISRAGMVTFPNRGIQRAAKVKNSLSTTI
jgi:hypothetical protein